MNPLSFFILLQVLDVATTLGVFAMGGGEMNPIVGHIMAFGTLRGLVLSKLIVIALATGAAFLGKNRGLRWANALFVAVLVWNCSIVARLAIVG